MTHGFRFWLPPFLLAFGLLAVVLCVAGGFNPLAWALEEAHAFAREIGGR